MIYFIPSWQSLSDGPTDFDDIVHQLKMFQKNNIEVEIILPTYLPSIRYQLNRQGLTNIRYWSVFEYLQNIKNNIGLPLKADSLKFPDQAQFIYTPICLIVLYQKSVFAKVYYSKFGGVSHVDYFVNDMVNKQNFYDDRGILSSVIAYDSTGKQIYMNYFDDYQNIKIHHDLLTHQVELEFEGENYIYGSIEELVISYIEQHLKDVRGNHTIILSACLENNYLTNLSHLNNRIIVSFSNQRFKFENKELLNKFLSMADILIADTKFSQRELEKECQSKHRNLTIHELPPFDANLKLGESQSMRQQVIYWYVDNSLAGILPTAIQKLTHRLITHKKNSIVIASKSSLQIRDISNKIFDYVKEFYQVNEESVIYQMAWQALNDDSENRLHDNELNQFSEIKEYQDATKAIEVMQHVEKQVITFEKDINIGLSSARVILDLNNKPDTFLQISGISAGLPQINMKESSYIVDRKNGLILKTINQLDEAIEYYLDTLNYWNESLVYNIEQIEKYSNKNNVQRWIDLVRSNNEHD